MRFPMRTTCLLALPVALAGVAAAATIRVPDDYPSVLAAVDAAAEADTVLIGPGTWSEQEERVVSIEGIDVLVNGNAFPRHGMTIRGEQGAATTTLAPGNEDGYVVLVEFTVPNGSVPLTLEGLTLSGAQRGIQSFGNGGLIVRDCRFVDHGPAERGGHGAAIGAQASDVSMIDCEVSSCSSFDGVVRLYGGASLELRSCVFEANEGKCVRVDNFGDRVPRSVVVVDCRFAANHVADAGACLWLSHTPDVLVARNVFAGNAALYVGGAVLLSDCGNATRGPATLEFNVFAYDSSLAGSLGGGAIFASFSDVHVRNNTFFGCHASLGGGAFSIQSGSVSFDRNVLVQSLTTPAVFASLSPVVTTNVCNLYQDNVANYGGSWVESAEDVHADPLFCDPPLEDWTVRENSPCAIGPCAPIGALGVGCEALAVYATSWSNIKAAFRR